MVMIQHQAGEREAIAAEPLVEELVDPTNGEIISRQDIDGLIDAFERIKAVNDVCYATLIQIRVALAALTEGTAKTRRVKGRRRKAKVEMPGDSWDQSQLKEAFNSYPQYRDDVLKIDTIGVKLREYAKLINTAGDESFTQFRDMVTRANRGPSGTPSVKVED
jgi:hypothetical protein